MSCPTSHKKIWSYVGLRDTYTVRIHFWTIYHTSDDDDDELWWNSGKNFDSKVTD